MDLILPVQTCIMFMNDNQTGGGWIVLIWARSPGVTFKCRSDRTRQEARAFANQCHHPTHTHRPAYSNTAECCARARVRHEMICAALGFCSQVLSELSGGQICTTRERGWDGKQTNCQDGWKFTCETEPACVYDTKENPSNSLATAAASALGIMKVETVSTAER